MGSKPSYLHLIVFVKTTVYLHHMKTIVSYFHMPLTV